jgi:DnaJ homolog subfamily A member 5
MTEVEGQTMVCHYEVMMLPMTCKVEEIKKQYKTLALRYHPDRNHGDEENATMKFKQLAAAYAVLSDTQERKWYDDHREAILRGGDGTKEDGDDQESINLWKYFNASCYHGHDDESPKGFYTVYRTVFEDVNTPEVKATKDTKTSPAPMFGNSSTNISDVLKFYSYWENFATSLSFSWVDTYNTVDAPNRATRRVMEKENLKARDIARKEYVNQIRSLANFVKKRDPRYVTYESEIKRKKLEEEELKKALKLEQTQLKKEKREQKMREHETDMEYLEARENERTEAFLLADLSEEDDGDSDYELGLRTTNRGKKGKKGGRSKGGGGGSAGGGSAKSGFGTGADPDSEQMLQEALKRVTLDDFIPSHIGTGTGTGTAGGTEAEGTEEAEDGGEAGKGGYGGGDGGGGGAEFACEICCKEFKTEAQLIQHNTSKPHRKKAQDMLKAQKKAGGGKGGGGTKAAATEEDDN